MRIYKDCYELMSELGRNLWEMGFENKPKTYQNKVIEGNDDFITKELICEQYCLTSLDKEEFLFVHDKRSVEWTKAELEERLAIPYGFENINPGDAWKVRPDLWEQFLNNEGKFDYSYNERIQHIIGDMEGGGTTNLQTVIWELKKNPDTRQAIIPVYSLSDVKNIGGKKRVPCTMYYNILIRENGKGEKQVNICYHQRSSDLVTHFGNDVYLAYKLMEFIAGQLSLKPGYLYHTIDSLHSYKKDWVYLKQSIGDLV